LESVYESCLAHELKERGLVVLRQQFQAIRSKRLTVEDAYRIDLIVQSPSSPATVFVELKAKERLLPIDEAQLLTHLKLSGCRLGLLINFNVQLLKRGICRLVNGFPDLPLCETPASSAPLR
jgi:GxxExxY protein